MTALVWDASGARVFETGVDHGVLYPLNTSNGLYDTGVAWNGLTGVTESPSGAESTPQYADNIKYLNLISAEQFGATIEAYTYPDEWAELDGSKEALAGLMLGQQERGIFGLCYRTKLGNDVAGQAYGYKLHLIYGAQASPSERAYQTINDSPEAINFSWQISCTPVATAGYSPVASLVIDSTKVNAVKLAALELILFGDVAVTPSLPLPAAVITALT